MPSKTSVAIVGSGNISTDLLYKLLRSDWLEPRWMIGIDPQSEGLARARKLGLETSHEGVDWLLALDEKPDLVFEATSAYVHRDAAPRYAEAGIRAIDLTPAAVGPGVIPPANLREHLDAPNVNMVTCGGQATIPMVYAVSRALVGKGGVPYAEIVASVSSASAGPGTRANIDEFTKTTSAGVEVIGGARRGKAIIILNPAEPPMIMRDTIFCAIPEDADQDAITKSIKEVAAEVATYVPGYRLLNEPQFDPPSVHSGGQALVTVFVEVEGAGDYLPPYAGNLDIMTAAATKVGEEIAKERASAGDERLREEQTITAGGAQA
jgi:acetaldehyde dehydrogenase